MTINTSGYTVGANEPLNHARILWNMVSGSVTAPGTNPVLATNDYTAQRWQTGAFSFCNYVVTAVADVQIDCVFIDGHNLAGKTIVVFTEPTAGGTAYVARSFFVVPDNSPLFILFNQSAGLPITCRKFLIQIRDSSNNSVAIIRAGVALQMPIPIYGGHKPLGQNRVTESQHLHSETGQWQGRVAKRLANVNSYAWEHVKSPWYAANFEPFSKTLPLKPFAIAGNPLRMPEDVGWCFTNEDIQVVKMGVLDHCAFSLNVTGFAG